MSKWAAQYLAKMAAVDFSGPTTNSYRFNLFALVSTDPTSVVALHRVAAIATCSSCILSDIGVSFQVFPTQAQLCTRHVNYMADVIIYGK
jgi:hypothetical protein